MRITSSSVLVDDPSKASDFYTKFLTSDIRAEIDQLKRRGVVFRGEPTSPGPITSVLFEDTRGNLVNLVQPNATSGA